METLPTLVTKSQSITNQIIENGGELTPELEEQLDNVTLDVGEKIDNYNFVMERIKIEETYWKSKADQMTRIARGCKNMRDRMKTSIKEAMKAMDTKEVEGFNYRFKLTNVKPKLIVDEAMLPVKYTKEVITHEANKERIREDLTEGIGVRGASLEQGHALRIYPNKGVK